jgi:anti-sigma factor RsiW
MPDLRCKQIFAALSEYLDGELPVKNCRELERHLKDCEPCLAYLENLKTTIQACRNLRIAKNPRPSARVRKALRQAVSMAKNC